VHLTRLVDDLLDVSRITRGKINIDARPFELSAAVARAVETVQPMMMQQKHDLQLDLPPTPLLIQGDLTRVTQVIGNVLANAVKYTDDGGRIGVSARLEGAMVEIRISDNGIGIPAAMLPTVFDLFSQAGAMDGRSRGGLGIGLALVKRLVEMHGGSVEIRSGGAGQGTEFLIRLPAALPANAASEAPTAPVTATSIDSKRRILIVDDNEDALMSLANLLGLDGHEVCTAANGFVALDKAPAFRPEVAVLDIGMPGLDGYELARRIRAQSWGGSMVLVALTGWGQESDRRRSREAGFDSHWVKPLDVDHFARYIERLFEEPKSEAG
jgi:CheY-like chemotaxis protein/anti-sigma regulatory factor (Ser/Thr protein kinase)